MTSRYYHVSLLLLYTAICTTPLQLQWARYLLDANSTVVLVFQYMCVVILLKKGYCKICFLFGRVTIDEKSLNIILLL